MEIFEKEFNNKKYYFIGEYKFKFGTVYKFSSDDETIFCEKIEEDFKIIKEKRKLKEINNFFNKVTMKDVL